MAISTKPGKLDKKAKIEGLKVKHVPLFELENVKDGYRFIPKMAYVPTGGTERVVSFFLSEINSGVDVYTEFVSRDYDPEDPERRLWKWVYNEEYDEEYLKEESKNWRED